MCDKYVMHGSIPPFPSVLIWHSRFFTRPETHGLRMTHNLSADLTSTFVRDRSPSPFVLDAFALQ